MQRRFVMLGSMLFALVMVVSPARAQQKRRCLVICAPTFDFRPSLMRTHVFSEPTVRSLTTGAVTRLPSTTAFALQFLMNVPTIVPRTSLFASVTWFPNLPTKTNPFTEYTSSEVPGTAPIKSNQPSIGFGAFLDVITTAETGGWFDFGGYIGDSFSAAAEPTDIGEYTHKLDLGLVGTIHPFSPLPARTYLRNVSLLIGLDYRATGLPSSGDEVPKGERVFVSGARPAILQVAFDFPIAPLYRQP